MSEHKHGQVAKVTHSGGDTHIGVYDSEHDWWTVGYSAGFSQRAVVEGRCTVTPLVTIDASDRETVARLALALNNQGWDVYDAEGEDQLADALRSLLADPKPEEPKGLGAVVEVPDQYGGTKHIVRADLSDAPWWDGEAGESLAWADLPGPIKVCREGMVADA